MIELNPDSSYPQIAAQLVVLTSQIGEAEAHLRSLKRAKEVITDEILPKKLNQEGVSTVHVKDFGRLSIRTETRVSTKAGQAPILQQWLTANGYEELIKPTVNSSTLKSFIKECIQEGRDYPDELINMHSFERVTLTKS